MQDVFIQRTELFLFALAQNPCFTVAQTHMQIEKQSRVAIRTLFSTCRRRHSFVNNESHKPQARNRSSRGRRCVFLSNIQDHHHQASASDEKKITSYHWLWKLTKSTDKQRHEICWELPLRRRNHHATLANSLSNKQHLDPLYIRAIPGGIQEPISGRTSRTKII